MTMQTMRSALRRRWYLAVLGLVLTAALCGAATIAVPPKYLAKADVLLLPPGTRGTSTGSNPYLGLAGYEPFADIVARAMSDIHTVDKLRHLQVADSFTVERDLTTNGPVLLITVDGSNSARVVSELATVVAAVPAVTEALQTRQSVATRDQFISEVITRATHAAVLRKSQIRAVVVALAFGLFATALLTSVLDRLLSRRPSRVRRRPSEQQLDERDEIERRFAADFPAPAAGEPTEDLDGDLDADLESHPGPDRELVHAATRPQPFTGRRGD